MSYIIDLVYDCFTLSVISPDDTVGGIMDIMDFPRHSVITQTLVIRILSDSLYTFTTPSGETVLILVTP